MPVDVLVSSPRAALPHLWWIAGRGRSRPWKVHEVRCDRRRLKSLPRSGGGAGSGRHAVSAVRGRMGRLRRAMASAQIDGLLVSNADSRRYLSGYTAKDLPPRESAGYLLVTEGRQLLFT